MKLKENIAFFVIFTIFFLLLYTFLAVRPIGSELYTQTRWTVSLDTIPVFDANAGTDGEATADVPVSFPVNTVYPFKLGNKIGYFTENGEIFSGRAFSDYASISSSYWTNYDSFAKESTIYHASGDIAGTIKVAGFPYFEDDRIFMFLPGGSGLAQYESDGTLRWQYEDVFPLVSFDSSPAASVLGYADGKIVYLTPAGETVFSFYPRGSLYQVILSSAVSGDGSLVAILSGLDSQRFVLLRVNDGQSKVIYHEYLEGNLTRQSSIYFDDSNKYVVYEYAQGLGILDVQTLKSKKVPIEGRIVSIQESGDDELFFVLSQKNAEYILSVIEKPGNEIVRSSFPAKHAFLAAGNVALYIGSDNTISRIDIIRKD